jgi:glutamyl-tRNA synthetase
MRNYLLRLGWSHGNDEIIPTSQAIAWFDLGNIGRSPARFDFKKLDSLNAHYMREMDDAALADTLVAFLAHTQPARVLDGAARTRIAAAMPGLKERAKTLVDLAEAAAFLYAEGKPELDAQAEMLLSPDGRLILAELLPVLQRSEWEPGALETQIRALADATGRKLGQVAQPLRAALTGKGTSPPIFQVMAVLGREETIIRIRSFAA